MASTIHWREMSSIERSRFLVWNEAQVGQTLRQIRGNGHLQAFARLVTPASGWMLITADFCKGAPRRGDRQGLGLTESEVVQKCLGPSRPTYLHVGGGGVETTGATYPFP